MAENTEEAPVKVLFDEDIVNILAPALEEVFVKHGDVLRGIGIFFDFYGTLNDANIVKGIWRGAQGPVVTPDGIAGSAMSCSRLLGQILEQNERLIVHLRTVTAELVTQVLEAEKSLAEKAQADATPVSDDQGKEPEGVAQPAS